MGKARRWAFKAAIGSESGRNVNGFYSSFLEELIGRTPIAQINGYFCETRSRVARNALPPAPIERVLQTHRDELASLVPGDSFANLRSSVVYLVQGLRGRGRKYGEGLTRLRKDIRHLYVADVDPLPDLVPARMLPPSL